jgi:hypothetical protein
MKKLIVPFTILCMICACDRKNEDLVEPNLSGFPQQIVFADEGDGDFEDSDKAEFALTLTDRVDPTGKEPRGTTIPLTNDAVVSFSVQNLKGFTDLSTLVLGCKAFYEVDDCTEMDVEVTYNTTTGQGTVVFPKGVNEIIIELELEPTLFDNSTVDEERGFDVKLLAVNSPEKVVINKSNTFEYKVLDDEVLYGKWSLDAEDSLQLNALKKLFGDINEDLAEVKAEDIEEIEVEFEYDKVTFLIVLKETETITECGETEEVNKEIEIEADYEDVEADGLSGKVVVITEIEAADGSDKEIEYEGEFNITGSNLLLKLGNDDTGEVELSLEK